MVIGRVKELLASPKQPQVSLDLHRPVALWSDADPNAYFDRLDDALAGPGGALPENRSGSRSLADEIDWFSNRSPATPSPAPAAWEVAPASVAASPDLPLDYAPGDRPAWAAARTAVPTLALPPLTDVFVALLAAERSGPPMAPLSWPAPAPPVSEEAIEEVARRVLDRLSDRVVRDTVADIVSKIAERLVREEIDRIKRTLD
jgi:hypothetical protein